MSQIQGYVDATLTNLEGKTSRIRVGGDEFGLEEGGDWKKDRDEGVWQSGFLFIAFCDGFNLHFSVGIYGNSVTHRNLTIHEENLEEHDLKSVVLLSDELSEEGLNPPNTSFE